eukprot:3709671-Rhodomonas_salina.1
MCIRDSPLPLPLPLPGLLRASCTGRTYFFEVTSAEALAGPAAFRVTFHAFDKANSSAKLLFP